MNEKEKTYKLEISIKGDKEKILSSLKRRCLLIDIIVGIWVIILLALITYTLANKSELRVVSIVMLILSAFIGAKVYDIQASYLDIINFLQEIINLSYKAKDLKFCVKEESIVYFDEQHQEYVRIKVPYYGNVSYWAEDKVELEIRKDGVKKLYPVEFKINRRYW